MPIMMKIRYRRWIGLGFVLLMLAATGCVEQRFIIITDPEGAIVFDERHKPLSASPADKPFIYYGIREFTLVKEGYETKVVQEKVDAPWYELPLLDFVTENLIPWTIRDVRTFRYTLTPLPDPRLVPPLSSLPAALALRARGEAIGQPRQAQSSPKDFASMPSPFAAPGERPLSPPAPSPFNPQPTDQQNPPLPPPPAFDTPSNP